IGLALQALARAVLSAGLAAAENARVVRGPVRYGRNQPQFLQIAFERSTCRLVPSDPAELLFCRQSQPLHHPQSKAERGRRNNREVHLTDERSRKEARPHPFSIATKLAGKCAEA